MLIRVTSEPHDVDGLRPFIEAAAAIFAQAVLFKLKDLNHTPIKDEGSPSVIQERETLPLNTPRRLVTVGQLAEEVGQAKSSLYRLAKSGKIPSYAAGPNLKGLRFDVEEVLRGLRHKVENHAV